MCSGTTTPGTSFAMNSAFLNERRGQIPAMMGIRSPSIFARNLSSCSTSNTG